jgi:hypothetical protein
VYVNVRGLLVDFVVAARAAVALLLHFVFFVFALVARQVTFTITQAYQRRERALTTLAELKVGRFPPGWAAAVYVSCHGSYCVRLRRRGCPGRPCSRGGEGPCH